MSLSRRRRSVKPVVVMQLAPLGRPRDGRAPRRPTRERREPGCAWAFDILGLLLFRPDRLASLRSIRNRGAFACQAGAPAEHSAERPLDSMSTLTGAPPAASRARTCPLPSPEPEAARHRGRVLRRPSPAPRLR